AAPQRFACEHFNIRRMGDARRACVRRGAHARIDPMPIRRSQPSAPAVVVRDDIGLASIPPTDWNELMRGIPLLSHAFLSALHETGCAGPAAGWRPCYLSAWSGERLAGVLPLYAKTH